MGIAAVQECGFKILQHLLCSPDTESSDYYLFLKINKDFSALHFKSDDYIISVVEHFQRSKMPTSRKMGSVCYCPLDKNVNEIMVILANKRSPSKVLLMANMTM